MSRSLRHFSCAPSAVPLPRALPLSHSHLGDHCRADLPTRHPYLVRPVQPMTGRNRLSQSWRS